MTSKNPYTKLFNSFKKLINLVEAEKLKGDPYNRTFKIMLYRSVREYLDYVVNTTDNTDNNTATTANNTADTTSAVNSNRQKPDDKLTSFYSIPLLNSYLQDRVIAELSSAVKAIFLHAGEDAAREYLRTTIGGFVPNVEIVITHLGLFFNYVADMEEAEEAKFAGKRTDFADRNTMFAGGEGRDGEDGENAEEGCLKASKWLESLIENDEKRAELKDRVYRACVESMKK